MDLDEQLGIKLNELMADRMAVHVVQYKRPNKLNVQIKWLERMEDARNLTKINWQDHVKISDDYVQYCPGFLKLFTKIESIWDIQLSLIKEAYHRIELSPEATRPIHSAHCRAKLKSCKFEKNNISRMLGLKVIKLTQAEGASATVSPPRKNSTIQFFDDYSKLNAVIMSDSYPIPCMF